MSSINVVGQSDMSATERADTLRRFLVQRRWFRNKARGIQGTHVRDSIPIAATGSDAILLDVQFDDGDTHTYLLTLEQGGGERDALENPKFTQALLEMIADEGSFS